MVVCDFHLCNKIKKSHTILYRPLEVLDSTLRTSALHYVMNMGCVCVCVCVSTMFTFVFAQTD